MCIQSSVKVDDGSSNEIQTEVQDNEVENNEQYDIIDNQSMPDHLKTKIKRAMIKLTKNTGNNKNNNSDVKKINNVIIEKRREDKIDILGESTGQLKSIIDFIMIRWNIFKNSNAYKILFGTTQPAHIIAIIGVLWAVSAVIPSSDVKINNTNQSQSKLLSFIYITSFILHMGSQFWMTFVSGLSLYFALPRSNFGQVQRVLFPRYFTINACFSFMTIVTFLKYHPFNTWNTEISIQIGSMFTAFFLELIIRLYLTPPLIGLMTAKSAIEKAAGIGTEVGHYNLGPLENCPHYLKMNRAFRKIHMNIAMGNIVTMVCTVIHLNYIAGKICM